MILVQEELDILTNTFDQTLLSSPKLGRQPSPEGKEPIRSIMQRYMCVRTLFRSMRQVICGFAVRVPFLALPVRLVLD